MAEISRLLERLNTEVYPEHDRNLRTKAIAEIFADNCLFIDPAGPRRGLDVIDEAAQDVQRIYPNFKFALGKPQALDGVVRLTWAFGPPENPRQITGQDVAVIVDGKIAELFTFADEVDVGADRIERRS